MKLANGIALYLDDLSCG